MTHVIRTAGTDDAGRLAELAAITFPLACPPGSPPADIAAHVANTLSEDNFRAYLADPDVTVIVIDAAGELRGYSLLVARPARDPDVAEALTELPCTELSKCYVHPDHHGLGAAAELMHASIASAAASGARGLWLGVNSQNARAIRFYEKSGFRTVGTKSFQLGNTVEHDFVMERPVTPRMDRDRLRDQDDSPSGNEAGVCGVVASMKIEIWSDVACPWCYIGKRRFETALAAFPHRDSVEVQWRSYQLDPALPERFDGTELEYLSTRKGMAPAQVSRMFEHVAAQAKGEGLNFRFDDVVAANSFTAHRLIHLAAAHGKQDPAKERLLSDHFEHGKDIGNREYLTSLGLGLGLDAGELAELFTTDKYADDVRRDTAEARALGLSGVPFFVIDRKFGLSGAQPAETFSEALEQAWQESHPLVMVNAAGGAARAASDDTAAGACGPDGCAV